MALTRNALKAISEARDYYSGKRIDLFFPDYTDEQRKIYHRDRYQKHLDFFAAGKLKRERLALCANRVGKTEGMGGYEVASHLTGEYTEWWPGRVFEEPIRAIAAGVTRLTTRDVVQRKLLGEWGNFGTGMIPRHAIVDTTPKQGVSRAIDTVYVKHWLTGRISQLKFMSYDQGARAVMGDEQHLIWCDEEPPLAFYTEAVTRTMTTGGICILTFTPLLGMSEVVQNFMEEEKPSRAVVSCTWDDVPHLSEEAKADMLSMYPPHQRDARSKGIPALGAGAVYPVPESEILVSPFEIPKYWRRAYGFDVGWNKTAAIWGAHDPDSDIVYLYSEHYQGQQEPPLHAEAIRRRGQWIFGAIDPAARGRGQKDGERLRDNYIDLGLNLADADNTREAGIYEVWTRLSTGRLKVFSPLANWLSEYRLYRRDEKGNIVKERDHLMDATRYLIMTGLDYARTEPHGSNALQYSTAGIV